MNSQTELNNLDRLYLQLQEKLDSIKQEQERVGARITILRRQLNKFGDKQS